MEIISVGSRDDSNGRNGRKKYKWKCKRCSSIFIAFEDEMNWSVEGHGMCAWTVNCPVCYNKCNDILDSCKRL